MVVAVCWLSNNCWLHWLFLPVVFIQLWLGMQCVRLKEWEWLDQHQTIPRPLGLMPMSLTQLKCHTRQTWYSWCQVRSDVPCCCCCCSCCCCCWRFLLLLFSYKIEYREKGTLQAFIKNIEKLKKNSSLSLSGDEAMMAATTMAELPMIGKARL